MNEFWNNYPDLKLELQSVNRIIEDSLKDSETYIIDTTRETINSGGKMLRPAFVLLGSKFGTYSKNSILNIAAIVEMLHIATLIHDDVIDNSKLRRGVESIQSKYGKDTAVFVGDYLFAKCFSLITKDYSKESMNQLSKAILNICRGELKQYSFRYKYNFSIMNYLRIITGKTAALFSMSLYIGAEEADVDIKVKKLLSKIGYRVGMAFQIIDDCLDYSKKSIIKKNTMNDLKQGYLTLPVIYALQNDSTGNLKKILTTCTYTEYEIEEIHTLVIKNNGLEDAKKLALKYTNKAFDTIKKLPDTDNKNILKEIITQLLNRQY